MNQHYRRHCIAAAGLIALSACTTDSAPVQAGTAGETTCGSTRVGQVHCHQTHDAPEPVVNEVPKN